jgi:putative hemolysin
MTSLEITFVILFFICVLASAFFSIAEIAFISLQRYKLEHLIETNVPGASLVAALVKHPEKLLSTILLGSNFFNTAAAALGTAVAVEMFGQSGVLAATIGVTVILLVFADTIPKTTSAHHAETLAISLAKTVRIISIIFTPAVVVLSWLASFVGRRLGAHTVARSLVSPEEIRTMINVGHKEGTVNKSEATMLHNVFEFGDHPARDIMVQRRDVIWVEKGSKVSEFLQLYTEHPMNRFPVFAGNRDNVVGILSVKDVFMTMAKHTCDLDRTIDELIRPAYFAPETKRIGEILSEMQEKNYHLCVIVDEYGGTVGIITITQLVEEIVGDLRDELTVVDKDFEIIDDYTFQIDGSMRIDEVNQEMNLSIPGGDYETIAGFLLSRLGHIPKLGEQVKFRDLKIVITQLQGNKIEEVLVTKEKEKYATPPNTVQPRAGS